MKFLSPSASADDSVFGILTSPQHKDVPVNIRAGKPWAADNNAFTMGFKPDWYFPWLESMKPYRDACLFVVVPDVVGDAIQTLDNYRHWLRHFEDWSPAFVAQDGQENLPFPNHFDTLFIGGSTEWKESMAAVECIKRAQGLRKHIHIGRVNWKRRYDMFNILDGSIMFTCDGTRPRFEGYRRAHDAWNGYERQRPLITI